MRSRRANEVRRASETENVQLITTAGASGNYTTANIRSWGFTRIVPAGTGAGWAFQMELPRRAGIRKTICVTSGSTCPVVIYPVSTAAGFIGGTTANVITTTTGTNLRDRSIQLMSVSTAAWALVAISTGISIGASTSPF